MCRQSTRWLPGVAVIAVGVVWLLNSTGLTEVNLGRLIGRFWPLLVVGWGIVQVLGSGSTDPRGQGGTDRGQLFSGAVVILVGLLLLGNNLGWYSADVSLVWKLFWPLVLILAGWSLLRGGIRGPGKTHLAVLGALERSRSAWELENGTYIAFMGGIKLDLGQARIREGEFTLDLTAVMGGIEVRVPEGLNLVCEGTAIMGGVNLLNEEGGGILTTRKSMPRKRTPLLKSMDHAFYFAILADISFPLAI